MGWCNEATQIWGLISGVTEVLVFLLSTNQNTCDLTKTQQWSLIHTFISERPAALHTAEALWMPVLIERSDHFLHIKQSQWLPVNVFVFFGEKMLKREKKWDAYIENGFIAVCAVRRVQAKVIWLAVRTPVLLKEVTVPQFTFTLGANKVFRVPHPPQRCHHLQHTGIMGNRGISIHA